MIFIPQEYKEWAIAALAAVSLVLVLSLMWYLADEEELEEYHDEHIPEEKINNEIESRDLENNSDEAKFKHIAHESGEA